MANQDTGKLVDEENSFESGMTKDYEDMYENFSAIDVHDHYRRGILQLEHHWRTTKWWHRLLTTVLGVIFTHYYFVYRHEFQKFN